MKMGKIFDKIKKEVKSSYNPTAEQITERFEKKKLGLQRQKAILKENVAIEKLERSRPQRRQASSTMDILGSSGGGFSGGGGNPFDLTGGGLSGASPIKSEVNQRQEERKPKRKAEA